MYLALYGMLIGFVGTMMFKFVDPRCLRDCDVKG